ncbi:bifunctional oligoribonuclease/PAP phosphatase NrnA [Patescibacteria group bacterium]
MQTNKIQTSLEDLAKELVRGNRVALLTHISPDIDGIGSMLALGRALEQMGIQVDRILTEAIPRNFFFLADLEKTVDEILWEEIDAVVALDCGDVERTGVAESLAIKEVPLINIDHHPQSDPFGDHAYVDPERSSTAEIIYDLLENMSIKIDKVIADMILAGIVCDTQGFQVANTSPRVLEIASELMRCGARIPSISRDLFRVKPLTALRLWGRVLDRIQVDQQTEMAYSVVREDDFEDLDATKSDLEGLINLINSASDAKFSLLLSEDGNNLIKGSLRSEEFEQIDVSKIAELFGGGGHRLASGFKFPGRIDEQNGTWVIKPA